ncbi:MAG: sn-glycerol-3-phosphate ABC transporter ATP-binding protein UgpC [Candidatus Eisenbacteria bacterium]|jgi:multiple sugar transport system ATP-binding protein|nr:sn-glycerol-3-phosphate ABC transporter ATP-binding protein UgpC [Candidatus Eisenbacteria bacterium]
MAKVTLDHVTKRYPGGVEAVRDACFEVRDKEFVVLVGPSGCGKSTLLRMVAGLEEISEGRILIDDRVVNAVPPKDRDIAMVFQNYALYPHMSVYDNMAFGLRMRKFSADEIKRRVNEAAGILGIQGFLSRKPKALSGGQRQRVAVGRAIVRHPKVFLFDEPLSNLDAKLRVQMRAELSSLHRRLDATMIYVTHDQTEAMTMGDRIVVLKDGIIQQIDDPLRIYHRPANTFVAGFIGSPAINLLQGMLTGPPWSFSTTGFTAPLPDALTNGVPLTSGPIVLGIRPEHIVSGEADGVTLDVILEVVEPMGHETYLHFDLGPVHMTARQVGAGSYRVGEKGRVNLDLAKAHLFDPASGSALRN